MTAISIKQLTWTDEAKAELRLLALHLRNMSIESSRRQPCLAEVLEGYAKRIDDLMKDAPQ